MSAVAEQAQAGEGLVSAARFLAASPAPALEGAQAIAEQLVLLVHRGVDWDVWGGARRVRYWDALTDRVRAGTYAGPSLAHWWQGVCQRLSSTPRTPADRAEVAALLSTAAQRQVLVALRSMPDVLVLRVRVAVEAHREQVAARVNRDTAAVHDPQHQKGRTPR